MTAGEKIIGGLQQAVAHIKTMRGTNEQWIERSNAVSRFIAGLHDSTRVFARGEVRTDKGHYPAVLTFNSGTRQTWAWAPSGRNGAIEQHHEMHFWANQDWKGSCREALADEYIRTAAKPYHRSDCATSGAPALVPGPCDCDAPAAKAMSAGTAETQSGSGREPASAVGLPICPENPAQKESPK